MKKVLVIGHTYIISANRGKLRHLNELMENDITVLCPFKWKEPDFGIKGFEPERRSSINFLTSPITGAMEARKYSFGLGALYKIIKEKKPDIVHLEAEAGSLISLHVSIIKLIFRFKLVLFVWDNIPCADWYYKSSTAFVYPFVNYLIAGSDQARVTAGRQGYNGAASVLPQLGIETGRVTDAPSIDPWQDRMGFRLGFVGRLKKKKGVHLLLKAMKEAPETLLTIVGDGDDKEYFIKLATSLEIIDRVRFIGQVPHKEVVKYIKGFDVLILPSISTTRWKEQFGHVLIEAMAAGKPVIGSDSGVIPDVIGNVGILFKEGDTRELLKAINSLVNDKNLVSEYGERGLERAKQIYTDKGIAKKTMEIWTMVLDKR